MKRLAVILVNYNGWKDTKLCLISLLNVTSSSTDIEVIVVDNASKTSISPYIDNFTRDNKKIKITLIENKENKGFSGGNNVGIRHALKNDADYIMLLNNDTIVANNFIDPLVAFYNEQVNAGILGPKIYFDSGYEFHKDRYSESEKGNVIWYAGGVIDWNNVHASHRGVDEVDIGQYNRSVKTPYVSGCCMIMTREVIEKVGFFDETYFMYLEDVDFCMRALKAGFELWYIPASHIWHKNAQSSGESGSELQVYYQTRNRLMFGMKYASFRTKLALIRNSIHVVRTNSKRRKAIADFYLRRFGKAQSI